MSEEQLKAFIAKATDDQSIQAKLKAAKTAEDVVGIAKEAGFVLSANKLIENLTDEELEGLAGGVWTHIILCLSGIHTVINLDSRCYK